MNEQLKKITDSLKELQSIGHFEFGIDHNSSREKRPAIEIDKHRFNVYLRISELDSLETIAENIAICYTEVQKMKKLYLHKLNSPDLFDSLVTWSILNK